MDNEPESTEQATSPQELEKRERSIPKWLVLVVAVMFAASVFGIYVWQTSQSSCPASDTIVIDVYNSFMDSGANPNATRAAVFNGFEKMTHSCLTVNYESNDVANIVVGASSSQLPDIAIGLTEVTTQALGDEGYLIPYTPPGLAYENSTLQSELSPQHYATPYEWQYLGLDYTTGLDNRTGHAISQGDIFQTLASNASLAQEFLYENPETESVGTEFLMWEYQFYTSVLHENWTTFWTDISSSAPVPVPTWSIGINEFGNCGGCYPMFLSFGTDPAYFATFPPGFSMNTTFSHYNGTTYGWKTIYSAGIVRGGVHNLGLDQEFINWLLSPTVQSLIPANEWMYPANTTASLPGSFSANPPVGNVVALNSFTTPQQMAGELNYLLLEWQQLS